MATTIFFGEYAITTAYQSVELSQTLAHEFVEADMNRRIFSPYSVVMFKTNNKVNAKGFLKYQTYEISGLNNDRKLTVFKQLGFAFCMELLTVGANNDKYGYLLNANGTRFTDSEGEIKSGLTDTVRYNRFKATTHLYVTDGDGKVKGFITFNDNLTLGETKLFPKKAALKVALERKALRQYLFTLAKACEEQSSYLVRLNVTAALHSAKVEETETAAPTETAAKVTESETAATVTETKKAKTGKKAKVA